MEDRSGLAIEIRRVPLRRLLRRVDLCQIFVGEKGDGRGLRPTDRIRLLRGRRSSADPPADSP